MYPTKKLREVCEIKKWKKVNYSEQWKYNYIDIGILRTNIIEQYTNDEWIFCNKNDILIAWDGSKSGTVGFWLEWVIGSTLAKITIDTEMFLTEFIGKFLQGNFDYLNKNTSGAAIPHLWKDILINLEIPLPPLSTQKLIVEKLDMIFAEIEKSKNLLEKNLQNVDEMNKSVLEKIFANDKWERKKLGEVCEKITDGTHQTPKYFDSWIIFLSSKNVTKGVIDWKDVKYIDEIQHVAMQKRIVPQKWDILLAKNWTTGIWAIVDKDEIFDIYVSLALLRPKKENIISEFLWYLINSPLVKRQFSSRLKWVWVPNLHLKEIKEVQIPLPPLSKQQKIVEYLDNIFAKNQKLKNLYQAQIKNLDEMKQSFLKKAFAGDLV